MSGLLALLQQSAMSLQAQQSASSTASHNLSNANTVGFSRQRADLAAVTPAERVAGSFLGRGAMLFAVSQARDRFIEAQIPAALGRESKSGTEAQTLKSVTALDVNNGLAPAISEFYTQLRALAQNPSSMSYRSGAVSAANQLALTFNRTATAIEAARTGIDSGIEGRLGEVNQAAQEVARLNTAIRDARASGAEPNDLLDARLRLGDKLATMMGATPIANKEGDLNLALPDGTALVTAGRASTFSVLPNPANSGLAQIYVQKLDGTSRAPLSGAPGGEVGGLLSARDGALKKASDELDQLAFDFTGVVNTASQAGFALDGSTGRDLFSGVTGVTGAARAMKLEAAIGADPALFPGGNSAAPGDGTAVQAIIGTGDLTLSSGTTVSGALARITSDFGATASRVATMNEGDLAITGQLQSMRESASGVSIDEELVNMQKAQRAYEAVTRVIKTADEMLQTLMSLK